LTEPSESIRTAEQRRRARLLAGILAATLLLGLVSLILTLIELARGRVRPEVAALVVAPLILMGSAYGLSRSRHLALASFLTVGVLLASTLSNMTREPLQAGSFGYVLLPGLVSGLIFSGPTTAVVFALTLVGVAAGPWLEPEIPPSVVLNASFLLLITASLMTVAASIRDRDWRTIEEQSHSLEAREAELQSALHSADEATRRMREMVAALELRNRETTLLGELRDLLVACGSTEELAGLFESFGPLLFPQDRGYLYLFRASRDVVELIGSWPEGAAGPEESGFQFSDCVGLRLGRPYLSDGKRVGPMCAHVLHAPPRATMCVPMIAQGEVLGLFHLRSPAPAASGAWTVPGGEAGSSRESAANEVAGILALAVSALNLQERLRHEAILDPLTGLFNRRYLDATLDREIHRAARSQRPLGVIMLDLDHFKRLNDSFGHQAGDEFLRAAGDYLESHVRAGDIACRFGGEEFALVLPEASLANTSARAEKLIAGLRELRLEHRGRALDPVSMSGGVAAFPEHGSTAEELLRAADHALYRAKALGRNRVVVAPASDEAKGDPGAGRP
jgi:diguanylate cyclase (GGDEF)-like protein